MGTLIRLATAADGPTLAAVYAPAVSEQATSFELEPPDGAEMARRVASIMVRTPWLVCEHDGQIVGYAYAGPHRERPAYQWSVEVSAYVVAHAQRRGVGTALYRSLFDLLELQGFCNAYAGITLPNPASVRLHSRLGFRPIGVYQSVGYKLGRWHDVAWFVKDLAPHRLSPEPPRPLPELAYDPRLAAALAGGSSDLRLGESPDYGLTGPGAANPPVR
jgi:L-amino acid N-acyltransferase YncA